MLIGQDPTIFNKNKSVEVVLMLDKENGSLKRWIIDIFGKENFEKAEIHATNLVKCTFSNPPSLKKNKEFLQPFFANCKKYLKKEISAFEPELVITFGENTHINFLQILNDKKPYQGIMKLDFRQNIQTMRLDGVAFKYSPCLHIKTYRVAETYGEAVMLFKKELRKTF